MPLLTPLVAKAQCLNIRIPCAANLDDLRSAAEQACERLRAGGIGIGTDGHPSQTFQEKALELRT